MPAQQNTSCVWQQAFSVSMTVDTVCDIFRIKRAVLEICTLSTQTATWTLPGQVADKCLTLHDFSPATGSESQPCGSFFTYSINNYHYVILRGCCFALKPFLNKGHWTVNTWSYWTGHIVWVTKITLNILNGLKIGPTTTLCVCVCVSVGEGAALGSCCISVCVCV